MLKQFYMNAHNILTAKHTPWQHYKWFKFLAEVTSNAKPKFPLFSINIFLIHEKFNDILSSYYYWNLAFHESSFVFTYIHMYKVFWCILLHLLDVLHEIWVKAIWQLYHNFGSEEGNGLAPFWHIARTTR